MLQKLIYSMLFFLSSKFSIFLHLFFIIVLGRTCYGTTVLHKAFDELDQLRCFYQALGNDKHFQQQPMKNATKKHSLIASL